VGPTVAEAVKYGGRALVQAGVDSSRLDAQVLLAAVLNVPRETVFGTPERVLTDGQFTAFAKMVSRRSARQPVSQIVGRREFWGRDFRVTRQTLTPRPDSETLIEAVLSFWRGFRHPAAGGDPPRVLDLGAGSGCLLLTLLAEIPGARGVGVEISEAALEVARDNAARLGLEDRAQLVQGDWCSALPRDSRFDIVVANPPYIAESDWDTLAPEVAEYEPGVALRGGADGLDAYRAIAPQALRVLAPGGIAAFEVGIGQAPDVGRILSDAGLRARETHKDLAGVERCVLAGRA
jgi:release factor glutamine methyltransferase